MEIFRKFDPLLVAFMFAAGMLVKVELIRSRASGSAVYRIEARNRDMDTLHPHLKKRLEYLNANPRLKEIFERIPLYKLGDPCAGGIVGKERAGLPNAQLMQARDITWPLELDEEFKGGRSVMVDPFKILNAIKHKFGSEETFLDTKTRLSKTVKKKLLKTFLISRVGKVRDQLEEDLDFSIEHLYWVDLNETKQYRFLLDDAVMGILEGEFLKRNLGVVQMIRSYAETDIYLRGVTIPESWFSAVADELFRYGLATKNRDGTFAFADFSRETWLSDIDRWISDMMKEVKETYSLHANDLEFRTEFERLIEELESNLLSVSKSRMNHHDLHCHVFAWGKTKHHSDEIFQRAKKLSCPYLHWRHFIAQMDRLYSPLYNKLITDENQATLDSWKQIQELFIAPKFQPRRFKSVVSELVKERFERLFTETELRKQSVFIKKRSIHQGT